jgi:hypothetical protein
MSASHSSFTAASAYVAFDGYKLILLQLVAHCSQKARISGPFEVAGAGFEPATSGL